MVYTFVKAMGGNIGQSFVRQYFDFALELLEKAKLKNVKFTYLQMLLSRMTFQ